MAKPNQTASQAEAAEQRGIRDFCRARLASLAHAVDGFTTEEGTTNEQDELLFSAGFRDDLTNAFTKEGYSVDVTRAPDSGELTGRLPVAVWLANFQERDFAFVDTVGWVQIVKPTAEELIDHKLHEELRSNALHFLPEWACVAIREAYVARMAPSPSGLEMLLADYVESIGPAKAPARKAPAKKVARRPAT